jgi:hypothetical protein
VNVGDLKPMEFPIEFFLTYAWAPDAWPYERLSEFTRLWVTRELGAAQSEEIAELVEAYTKFNGRRKPESLTPAPGTGAGHWGGWYRVRNWPDQPHTRYGLLGST